MDVRFWLLFSIIFKEYYCNCREWGKNRVLTRKIIGKGLNNGQFNKVASIF